MNTDACTALRKDGQPCTARALRDGRCLGHATGSEARSRGGRASAKAQRILKALPPDLASLWDRILAWLDGVEAGTLTPRQAEAMAVLVSRLLDMAKLAAELGRTAELQERLAAIEAHLAEASA